MQSDAAETLALKALSWLAGEPDALLRFLSGSGLEPDDLREQAANPELLAAVLDFLLAEEPLLTAFCEAEGLKPATIHAARAQLPGATRE